MFIVKFSTQTTTVHRVSDINLFIPHIFIYRGITSLSRDIAMHYNSNNDHFHGNSPGFKNAGYKINKI